MKRYVIILAGSLLLAAAGCQSGSETRTGGGASASSSPMSSSSPTPSSAMGASSTSSQKPSGAGAASVAAAAPAAPKAYFEVKKDGKTWVVGSLSSLQKVNATGAGDVKWVEKTGANGETVMLESGAPGASEESLWGEYQKSHPKK